MIINQPYLVLLIFVFLLPAILNHHLTANYDILTAKR